MDHINWKDILPFDELSIEKKLTTADKKELPSAAYGLPKDRKYPLYNKDMEPDITRIHAAEALFNKCPVDTRKELANNILKAVKSAKIEVNKKSAWYQYTDEQDKSDKKKKKK